MTRQPNHDCTLSDLSLDSASLVPAFSADVFEYKASIPNAEAAVKVLPIPNCITLTILLIPALGLNGANGR